MGRCKLSVAASAVLLLSHATLAGIRVDGARIVVETANGRLAVERGVVVEMTNRLTGETYSTATKDPTLTGLLWQRTSRWLGADATLTCRKIGDHAARLDATLRDGHRLSMTVGINPATQDVVVRQSGSGPSKGLYAVQWGIAGLDGARVCTVVPGLSGVRLDGRTPGRTLRFHWPTGWEVQFVAVEGKRGGFAVWSQDTAMRFKHLEWARRDGKVALAFASHNHAPFDELAAVESVEWRLAFHRGDWRTPARRYRDWMQKAYGLTRIEAQRPAWAKDVRFVVIMGTDTKVLDALKAQVPPSATLLYIPGWRRDRYDKNYPDYTATEGFAEFVRTARRLGFHVMPHMNYFGCDPKHPAYERFKPWHMRSPFTDKLMWWVPPRQRGKPDLVPTIKFAYINPASKAWRDELVGRLVEAQRRCGFDAIHLDQTLCITNDANGAIDGLRCPQGNVLLHRQLREAMPDVALSGEGLDEVTFRHEAFAQRHASGISHVHGTWDDARIDMGHPISSYFLAPYTRIYGYLGMAGPANRELCLAWKRSYEHWGVLPTYSRPSAGQIAGSDTAKMLLREARLWVDDELEPDFATTLGPGETFRLRGKGGVAAVYEADGRGGSRMRRLADGKTETVYAFVKGRRAFDGPGTIADWFAYDRRTLFGLNPRATYVYRPEPRDLRAARVAKAPPDALVRVLARDEHKLMAEFEGLPETWSHDFVARLGDAETGIEIDGRRGKLDHGAGFDATMAVCNDRVKRGFFAHPPWKVKGKQPARTVGRFAVALPKDNRSFLEFAIGLRDGVNERSDGARFLVEVEGEPVFDEVWAKSEWKQASVPLDRWRGRKASIAFVTTPGPQNSASFDWAVWGEPRVRFELPPRRIDVRLASPRPAAAVLGPDPKLTWRQTEREGMHYCDVSLAMPGRVILVWARAKAVALPLDLAAEPFALSLAVRDSPAAPPIQHAGARRGSAISKGTRRQGINAHPPNFGRTSIDYLLELPERRQVTLSFAVGLRDGSQSDSVVFAVEANGRAVFRKQITAPDGWHPAEVDLSGFAGKTLLLSLVVDSDGPHYFDWATWADPVLR